MLDRIDHLVVPVPDLSAAAAAYERLGLTLTLLTEHQGMGTANRAAFIGTGAANFAYVELLEITDRQLVAAGSRARYLEAADRGGALSSIAFGTGVMSALVNAHHRRHEFGRAGCERERRPQARRRRRGRPAGALPLPSRSSSTPKPGRPATTAPLRPAASLTPFPLKRLDHLAAVAPAIEAATDFWSGTLGVPVAGEDPDAGMIIRQLQVGDAFLSCSGQTGHRQPHCRAPGVARQHAAWEVSDSLDDAVTLARERDSPFGPGARRHPRTRRESIPAGELAGLGMQLLEYV